MPKFLRYPFRVMDGLADRVMALAGAIALAQFPQYFAQYIQRLGGHLDEARRSVSQYQNVAASYNLSLHEYINIHLTSGNKIFAATGKLISGLVERLQHLETAFRALRGSTPWNRWWVFLRVMDPGIARRTWENFTPGIPTTAEALVYALIGLLAGWGIYQGVKKLVGLPFRKPAAPKPLPQKPGVPA
jgi:hypothetical protein